MVTDSLVPIRLLVVVLLLSLPSLAEACGEAQANSRPQTGATITNGIYRNRDAGFKYRIPKGISASTEKSFNSDGSYVILTGTGSSARISVTVRNGDNTLVSPESHLRKVAELSSTRLGKFSTLPFDSASISDDWHRADYETDIGELHYGALVSIRRGAQWLDWTFTARSKKQLESLVASLATVKLYMSSGVSACLNSGPINRYRVAGNVMQQYLLKSVQPVYPAGWHGDGTVLLHAAIDKNGRVTWLRVISGDNADIAESALAAARQYEYRPYTVNERPVDVDTDIKVEFAYNPGEE